MRWSATTSLPESTGSTVTLNGTSYTSTTDAITLNGNVALGAGAVTTTVTTGGGAGDNLTVTGTINDAANDTALTLDAGAAGNVDLQGAVGNTGRIAALTVSNSAITDLNNVQTVGAIAVTAGRQPLGYRTVACSRQSTARKRKLRPGSPFARSA